MNIFRYTPNFLSIVRIFMAIPLAYWLWHGAIRLAVCLLIIAAITDLLDGFLAREFQWRTSLGSWLDPAADKIIITTSLITLTAKGFLPLWFCLITVGRDVGLVTGTFWLLAKGVEVKIRPLLTGKLATFAQNTVLILAVLLPVWSLSKVLLPFGITVAVLLTVISSVAYAKALAAKAGWTST